MLLARHQLTFVVAVLDLTLNLSHLSVTVDDVLKEIIFTKINT